MTLKQAMQAADNKKKAPATKKAPAKAKAPTKAAAKKPATPAKGKTTRPATKPEVKTAPKPVTHAPEAVAFVARLADTTKPIHIIDQTARPTSGARLAAHTHAALTVLGLLAKDRPAVPKRHLLTLMGQTAVAWHLTKQNIESAPNNGVRLTMLGYNLFTQRKVDPALANAFQAMFIDGAVDSALGVKEANLYAVGLGV